MAKTFEDFLAEQIDAALERALSAEKMQDRVKAALLGGLVSDRRSAPRPRRNRNAAPKRTCPAPGCKNGWTAANGGYCKDHLKSAGYRKWKASRGGKKKR